MPIANSWYQYANPRSQQPIAPGFDAQGNAIPFDERGLAGPNAPTPGTGQNNSLPELPSYDEIGSIIQQINATNQQAQSNANAARIPGATELETQSSDYIRNLFSDANDPNRVYGELDVPAASAAVASGTVGSPFAGVTGLRLTENERIRRGQLAQGNLSAALGRNPAAPIGDPQRLVEMGAQQAYGANQAALDRSLRERLFNAEMANRALQQRNAGRGGGGGYGPSLPTDYGRPGAGSSDRTYSPGIDPVPLPPTPVPRPFPGGVPNIGQLDNWADFDVFTQRAFNQAFGQNPYFGMPDYQNPYSGDDPPLPPLPNLTNYNADVEDFYNYT